MKRELTEQEIMKEQEEFMGGEIPFRAPVHDNMWNMEVEVLHPDAKAAKTFYHSWVRSAYIAAFETWRENSGPESIEPKWDGQPDAWNILDMENRLLRLLTKRPISVVLEIPTFVFRFTNISRSITHQLVRHRKMSFGQQSMRAINSGIRSIRLPERIINPWSDPDMDAEGLKMMGDLRRRIEAHFAEAKILYYTAVKYGVPREQARNILPMGTTTNITVAMDLRSLIEYLNARSSDLAQEEHRRLVTLLKLEIKEHLEDFWKVLQILQVV